MKKFKRFFNLICFFKIPKLFKIIGFSGSIFKPLLRYFSDNL